MGLKEGQFGFVRDTRGENPPPFMVRLTQNRGLGQEPLSHIFGGPHGVHTLKLDTLSSPPPGVFSGVLGICSGHS